ncbi:uncharacterized protein [Coffea arabica]|uniref:Endonuclease/exonuclease/phosphatase domain-containing protein n=1 Tax=Coffea arabica TaxID=13443 RepID=A0ABM4VQ99_COFAR
MRVLVWNCQGVGSPLTVPHLKEVNNLSSPSLIFLSETKNRKQVIDRIARGLRCDSNVAVEAMNKAVGTRHMIVGDFNDILSNEEKWEGVVREERSFKDFKEFIDQNSLIDIGFEGQPWTWSNHWDNEGEIQTLERKEKKRFYFDKRWLQREGVQQVVEKAWHKEEQGSRMFNITKKIKNCGIELLKWRNTFQANSRSRITDLKKELERVRDSVSENRKAILADIKGQLKAAYRKEENFWSQKARISWLRKGDKNTKYFHTYVNGRRVSNRIRNLQRENGSWTENEDEVVTEISDFFKELLTVGGGVIYQKF